MWSITTDGVAWSVCPSVGHVREPCKNGLTDRHAIRVLNRVGPSNHVLDRVEIPKVQFRESVLRRFTQQKSITVKAGLRQLAAMQWSVTH